MKPRDPAQDELLAPGSTALIIIDYQPVQVHTIRSMDSVELMRNVATLVKTAKAYGIPIILSTVNVKSGRNKDTIPAIKEVIPDAPSIDRSSINAWEDQQFHDAVEATGRKKLLMAALWTEACLTFPTLDAIREGYEVYPVVDAVGGTSVLSHETALRRCEQAGAHLISIAQLLCELQRDWARTATVPAFSKLLVERGAFIDVGDGV
jgi:nicotinamidase-related amidase